MQRLRTHRFTTVTLVLTGVSLVACASIESDETKATETESRAKDLADFAPAATGDSYVALMKYLRDHPQGLRASAARDLLESFGWQRITDPRLITWQDMGRNAPESYERVVADLRRKAWGVSFAAHTQGAQITGLERVLFATPGGDARPTKLALTRANLSFMTLATQGASSTLPLVEFHVVIPVGSEIVLAHSAESRNEVTARMVGVAGSTFSTASGGGTLPGLNVFGVLCRDGVAHVVAEGLELQPGTEVYVRKQ